MTSVVAVDNINTIRKTSSNNLILFASVAIILILTTIFAYRQLHFNKNTRPSLEKDSSVNFDTQGWKTYFSKYDTSFMGTEEFSFIYPPDLEIDHASGQSGTAAIFLTRGFVLSISDNVRPEISPNYASEYINNFIADIKAAKNCGLFPGYCDAQTFSVHKEKLPKGFIAYVASGPSIDRKGSIFENYYIQVNDKFILNMFFTFEDTERFRSMKNIILNSLSFSIAK